MTEERPAGAEGKQTDALSPKPAPIHSPKHFHLHLVSDASGETLTTIAKAAVVQIAAARPNRHMYPLIRNTKQLESVLQHIENAPGIVLYTLMNPTLATMLEKKCNELGIPSLPVLTPVVLALESYLNMPSQAIVGGQHRLDADYFRRIEAMNFSQGHDDSQGTEDLEKADIVLIGASRTSKTPTSIYLANRGYKTANVSLVPSIPLPPNLINLKKPFVVGLVASVERTTEIRRNRMQSLNSDKFENYVNADVIKDEMSFTKKLCAQNRWPTIDVTKKSIEETAATVISLYEQRRRDSV